MLLATVVLTAGQFANMVAARSGREVVVPLPDTYLTERAAVQILGSVGVWAETSRPDRHVTDQHARRVLDEAFPPGPPPGRPRGGPPLGEPPFGPPPGRPRGKPHVSPCGLR